MSWSVAANSSTLDRTKQWSGLSICASCGVDRSIFWGDVSAAPVEIGEGDGGGGTYCLGRSNGVSVCGVGVVDDAFLAVWRFGDAVVMGSGAMFMLLFFFSWDIVVSLLGVKLAVAVFVVMM
mmetsp:Transcript_30862/g.44915  ORF Transcript_30862/g.44915 Transcript_30862/m.44915 type:complete len:122 (-) Transcript_30862:948-1313(-)